MTFPLMNHAEIEMQAIESQSAINSAISNIVLKIYDQFWNPVIFLERWPPNLYLKRQNKIGPWIALINTNGKIMAQIIMNSKIFTCHIYKHFESFEMTISLLID